MRISIVFASVGEFSLYQRISLVVFCMNSCKRVVIFDEHLVRKEPSYEVIYLYRKNPDFLISVNSMYLVGIFDFHLVRQLAVNHECQRNLHHPLQRLSRLHVVALGKEHELVNTLKEKPEPVSHFLRSLELH